MMLTASEAIRLLETNPSAYATADQIRALVNSVQADAPGSMTLLYSGTDTKSFLNAALEVDPSLRVIGKTEVAKFLNSVELTSAALRVFGADADDLLGKR